MQMCHTSLGLPGLQHYNQGDQGTRVAASMAQKIESPSAPPPPIRPPVCLVDGDEQKLRGLSGSSHALRGRSGAAGLSLVYLPTSAQEHSKHPQKAPKLRHNTQPCTRVRARTHKPTHTQDHTPSHPHHRARQQLHGPHPPRCVTTVCHHRNRGWQGQQTLPLPSQRLRGNCRDTHWVPDFPASPHSKVFLTTPEPPKE